MPALTDADKEDIVAGRKQSALPKKRAARPTVDWQPTRLVLARKRAGLSQAEAAEKCSAIGAPMTRGALSQWEQGRTEPDGRQIAALAQVYGCERDAFFHEKPFVMPTPEA